MGETTKEDVRRMTEALTYQTTIDQLSKAGMVARNKREEMQAIAKRNAFIREEEMKKQQQQIKKDKGKGGDGKDDKGSSEEEDKPGDGQGGKKQD